MEVIDQFQNYLTRKSLCMLTIDGYMHDACQFGEWAKANDISLNAATPEDALRYVNYLVTSLHEVRPGVFSTYSVNTVRKKVTSVRTFFESLKSYHG